MAPLPVHLPSPTRHLLGLYGQGGGSFAPHFPAILHLTSDMWSASCDRGDRGQRWGGSEEPRRLSGMGVYMLKKDALTPALPMPLAEDTRLTAPASRWNDTVSPLLFLQTQFRCPFSR